jgi:two-component system, LytTR family, response regulator
MSVRAIIADDEPLARQSVRRFLRGHDVSVVEECRDGGTTIAAIRRHAPDLLFLDMEMPDAKGLSALAALGEKNIPVSIVITAHTHYAVEAYDINIADYILKPFGKERFEKALARALSRLSDVSPAASNSPEVSSAVDIRVDELLEQLRNLQQSRIPIPIKSGSIVLIKPSDVECVEAEENSLVIRCGTRIYEIRETLSRFHKRLNPSVFYRIHRSTVVNINHIREIRPWFHGYHIVILNSGRELRMSRYQSESVDRLIGSF